MTMIAGQPAPKLATDPRRFKMVCSECEGENIQADAYAFWSVERQEWEVSNVFDKGGFCDDCQGECRFEAVEV